MAKWNGPGVLRISGSKDNKRYFPGEEIDSSDLAKIDDKVKNKMIEKGQIDGNKRRTPTESK